MHKVGIVGNGNISQHLKKRLEERLFPICFSFGRERETKESFEALLWRTKPKVVFITISTLDEGQAARDYILDCVGQGIHTITCEKGALAYHAKALGPFLPSISFSATVGGGTSMLSYMKTRHLKGERFEIHVVLNGTLNFIFDEMRHGGRTLAEACAEASKLGYAEPGSDGPLSLINSELKDVMLKTCVFFNTVFADYNYLTPKQLTPLTLNSEEIEDLSRRGGDYRLIVSFSNHLGSLKEEFSEEKLRASVSGWEISGGFRKIVGSSEFNWLPGGVGNALHIIEGEFGKGGKYTLTGPGAGYEPTTSAMLCDFKKLDL